MRAKLIYEKFTEESDPIKDLGIGGIVINDIYENTVRKHLKEFRSFLDSFIGKRISFIDLNTKTRRSIVVHSIGQEWSDPSKIWFFDDATRPVKRVDPDLNEKIYIVD
jgi:hypothetical protein